MFDIVIQCLMFVLCRIMPGDTIYISRYINLSFDQTLSQTLNDLLFLDDTYKVI